MKHASALKVLFGLSFAICAQAQDGVLDLTTLHNYANQSRPLYITRDNTPGNNAITDAGATLGRVLFHDKRLSRDNTVSCASCHQQSHAFADTPVASTGVDGTTSRHSMRLINARFGNEPRFFWDERVTSLENQTTQPVRNHVEMGFSGSSGDPAFADLVTKLSAIPEYRVLFAMTFGNATISEVRIQRSLAQFVRSIQSFDSKYDTGRKNANDNQNFANFTTAENAGKQLFLNPPPQGGAGCAACHVPPEFSIDPNSRNNGVIGSLSGGIDTTNTRSPSLRDLVGPGGQSNGAFMHDGSLATLADVINHYNLIPTTNTPTTNANLDPRLRPGGNLQNLRLSQTQKDNLVAFMRTLTGTSVYTEEKWSNPFNAQNELELIILPENASTIAKNANGTATLRCLSAANLSYQLESSTDLEHWSTVGTMTADAAGLIERTVNIVPPAAFYRFTYTVPSP